MSKPAPAEAAPARIDPAVARAMAFEPKSPPYIPHAGLAAGQPNTESARARPQALEKQAAPISAASAVASSASTTMGDGERLTASTNTPQSVAACQTIGPIGDSARAGELKQALRNVANSVSVREETTPTSSGFIVVSPDQGSVGEAKALAKRMRAAGVDDMFVFGRGPHKGRVSLGLYRKEGWATERIEEVQAAGFFAEALPRRGEVTRYWVDFVSQSVLPPEAQVMLADLKVAPAECETTLASGR
jgi:hypothetical protein